MNFSVGPVLCKCFSAPCTECERTRASVCGCIPSPSTLQYFHHYFHQGHATFHYPLATLGKYNNHKDKEKQHSLEGFSEDIVVYLMGHFVISMNT